MRSFNQMRNDRYIQAIVLLGDVLWAYNTATKTVRNGRRDGGVLGYVGCQVFRCLAEKKGAFVRPVPYLRKQFIEEAAFSGGAIDSALTRLSEQGLVTLGGTGRAVTVQLQVPPHVFDLYQQFVGRSAAEAGFDPPVSRHELDKALALMDQPGFERFITREKARPERPLSSGM